MYAEINRMKDKAKVKAATMTINIERQIAKVIAVQAIDRAAAIEQISGREHDARQYMRLRASRGNCGAP
jgi:hypothetical protein